MGSIVTQGDSDTGGRRFVLDGAVEPEAIGRELDAPSGGPVQAA